MIVTKFDKKIYIYMYQHVKIECEDKLKCDNCEAELPFFSAPDPIIRVDFWIPPHSINCAHRLFELNGVVY